MQAKNASIQILMALSGLALGAGLMYLLDPDRGFRRRRYLKESMSRASEKTGQAMKDSAQQTWGKAKSMVRGL